MVNKFLPCVWRFIEMNEMRCLEYRFLCHGIVEIRFLHFLDLL